MVAKVGVGRADLTGLKFGRLVCLDSYSEVVPSGRRQVYWNCVCDCGNTTKVRPQQLKEGRIVSCGCKQKEDYKAKSENSFCLSDEYTILKDIIRRCNPESNCIGSKNYGKRGIRVDPLWTVGGREGYENFIKDMGARPSKDHSIERVDVDGNYCKENCIWTDDDSLQAYNQRPRKSKSGIPGVMMSSDGYGYRVTIGKDYIKHYIGYYKDIKDAAKARKQAELDFYGFNLNWELPE